MASKKPAHLLLIEGLRKHCKKITAIEHELTGPLIGCERGILCSQKDGEDAAFHELLDILGNMIVPKSKIEETIAGLRSINYKRGAIDHVINDLIIDQEIR